MTERTSMVAALDELGALLHDAEDRLVALSYGVRAEVPLEDMGSLGFGKVGGQWRLFFQPLREGAEPVPLNEATMRARVLAAHALPALERALDVAAVERHATILAAIEAAKAWLATRVEYTACIHPPASGACPICTVDPSDTTHPQIIARSSGARR